VSVKEDANLDVNSVQSGIESGQLGVDHSLADRFIFLIQMMLPELSA